MADQYHEDREILRNVDSSGLTSAERDLHYFEQMELEGGKAPVFRYWRPQDGRSDFPAGYEVSWEFPAAGLSNASDRVNEWYDIETGDMLTDADANAFQYHGTTPGRYSPQRWDEYPLTPEERQQVIEGLPKPAAERDGQADRIAAFAKWIGEVHQKGDGEWANFTEDQKLGEIYWESRGVVHGFTVPSMSVLTAIELNVDYAELPAIQREMLQALRTWLEGGQFKGSQQEKEDLVATALEQVVDAGLFEESLWIARERKDQPWAGISEDHKVYLLIEMAHDAGVWTDWWDDLEGKTPGAHVLATIEREVDFSELAPWRRHGLETLRAQWDVGEFKGENPYPTERTDSVRYALRLAELEAGIEDFKHIGEDDHDPGRYRRWGDMAEEAKLNQIMHVVQALHLDTDPKAYEVIAREVDLSRLPEETQREFERSRAAALPDREESPSQAEVDAVVSSALAGGFNWKAVPGQLTRPGPEETPLQRVERQIGHIKVLPDPYDFRIEELGPWDTAVSEEWKRLPEAVKLSSLMRQVDWREISADDIRRLLEREVDIAQVPQDDQKQIERDAPRETYQVWHDRGWPQTRINQTFGGWPPSRFPQEYFHAADVQAVTRQEAILLTTSSGSVLRGDHQPWDDKPGVRSYTPKPFVPRDTDAGDVIVDPQGQAHRYDGHGFQAINAALRQPVAGGLAQGQTAGSQRGREAKPASEPPHPWPSEIARANREKAPEQGHGRDNGQDKSNSRDDGQSL